jgi:hypothetical protein
VMAECARTYGEAPEARAALAATAAE